MKKRFSLSLSAATVMALIPLQASAHGYTDFPKARQMFCVEDGGYYWPTDGSGIPNQACRAIFQESGAYPFVQNHEFSANVADYTDLNAVKAVVADGQLCYGSDPKKSGMGVASGQWQRTAMQSGETFQLKFRATAPHNPSFWEIYLSKPSYNAAHSRLAWDDVELIAKHGNIAKTQIDGQDYYVMNVTLPAGRSGDATLLTRWQRDDAAGEGFYNCSDIRFDGDAPPVEWQPLGALIPQGLEAQVGDQVLFRIFDGSGQEVVEVTLPVTVANQSVHLWSYELALKVNEQYHAITQLGMLQPTGEIWFDQSDLYGNQVYVTNRDYRYALDIRDGEVIPPDPVEPSEPGEYDFVYPDNIGSYEPGKTVVLSRDGSTYQCRPFPEGGWCNINSASHYEPGYGSNWQDAWLKL
ncbi:chitin-binding protein [Photobacterium ganghwense]|uniref:lytic polysaccharide monooxygenase n=1 Tax=Photobacterium ganghwense TaxID=320778 RepID=UPI00069D750D|nr:lytic polysaccharide monooxygenase [Photobacterium ganghwense]PSU08192.1 chitin-binding protein [Photobacterium ganghwense]